MGDDKPLTDEELAIFDDEPLTQEEINAACRELAAEGVIEWDESTLRARLTQQGHQENLRRERRLN